MSRNQTQEAMPTNIAGFKDHPLCVWLALPCAHVFSESC